MRRAAVLQLDRIDCGPACLRYVLNCFGGDATVTEIRRRCELSDNGLSLLGISRVAPGLGLHARFFEASRADPSLGELVPWIAQLGGEEDGSPHYVVVDRMTATKVDVMDPGVGHLSLPLEEFTDRWTGYLATFTDQGVEPRRRDDLTWVRRWVGRRPRPRYLLASLLGAVLTGLLGVSSAYVLKAVADAMLSSPFGGPFWTAVIALLAFLVVQYVVTAGTTWVTELLAARMTNRSSSEVADLVRRLPWDHVAQMRHGDLVNRLKDPADVERFLIVTCGRLVSTVLGFVVGLAWVSVLYPGMLPAVVVAIALAVLSFRYFRRRLLSLSYRQKSRQVAIDTGLMDFARCREMLTAASAQDLLLDRFRNRLLELNQLHVRRVGLLALMGLVASMCPLIVMAWSVFRLWRWGDGSDAQLGELVFQLSATGFIFAGISSALGLLAGLDMMRVSFDRIMDVDLGAEPDAEPESGPEPERSVPAGAPLLRLRDLEFTVGARPARVDLTVERTGQGGPVLVGLTGTNGVGKSSLLRTLAGAAPATGGTVELDGRVHDDQRAHRRLTAYVPQHDQLFTASMWDNVSLGRPVPPERLAEVAEAVGLPRGARTTEDLRTVSVQNGGDNLSGGQARRIALARALIPQKRLLLLDEPFTGVDSGSAAGMLDHLASGAHDLIVIVSHDPTTLARCDQVIELSRAPGADEGRRLDLRATPWVDARR